MLENLLDLQDSGGASVAEGGLGNLLNTAAYRSTISLIIPSSAPNQQLVFPTPRPVIMLPSVYMVDEIMKLDMEVATQFVMDHIGRQCVHLSQKYGDNNIPIVLDVGENEGFFGTMMSSHDCRVIAVEAQPECMPRLYLQAAFNQFKYPIKFVNRLISDHPISFQFPTLNFLVQDVADLTGHGIINTACSVVAIFNEDGSNIDGARTIVAEKKDINRNNNTIEVSSVTIDSLLMDITSDVLVWHMDIEGSEIGALRSAVNSIKKKKNL